MRVVFCVLMACLFSVPHSFALDVVKLKDGTTVEGEIVEKGEDFVKMKVKDLNGMVLTYWMSDISDISRSQSQEEDIIIRGKLIYDDYKQGDINIGAFLPEKIGEADSRPIGYVKVSAIGGYTLVIHKKDVPEGTKEIIIRSTVDVYNEGPVSARPGRPRLAHMIDNQESRVAIDQPEIDNINLEFIGCTE
jgi:hypothetical protein